MRSLFQATNQQFRGLKDNGTKLSERKMVSKANRFIRSKGVTSLANTVLMQCGIRLPLIGSTLPHIPRRDYLMIRGLGKRGSSYMLELKKRFIL